ncbi:MAG: threonine/serine exporter family protein [Clostridiaceae bacterium]
MIGIVMSYFASLSFAFLFNLNRKTAFLTAFGGSIGWAFYILAIDLGADLPVAYFFGALALTLYSEIMARIMKTPVTSYVTPALIPLVPGGGLYQTMLKSISGDYNGAIKEGINTLMYSGALAIGILVVFTLIKTYYSLRRKLEVYEKN